MNGITQARPMPALRKEDPLRKGLLLVTILTLALAQAALIIFFDGPKGALLLIGAFYIYFLFRWPHIALLGGLVIILDGFGFLNRETFLRVAGLFKGKDIIFVTLFMPLVFQRRWQTRAVEIFRANKLVLYPAVAMVIMATVQMVATSLRHDLPLISCIQAGRHYWYYSMAPLAAIYIDTPQKRRIMVYGFLTLSAIVASIVVAQTVVLNLGGDMFLAEVTKSLPKSIGELKLIRIYVPGVSTIQVGLCIAVWLFYYIPEARGKRLALLLIMVCPVAIFLLNSRMLWVMTLAAIAVPPIMIFKMLPKRIHRGIIRTGFLGATVLFVLLVFNASSLLSSVASRFESGFIDFTKKGGTWQVRMQDSQFRFNLIKEYPLFGVGLVHYDYAAQAPFYATLKPGQVASADVTTTGGTFHEDIGTTDSGIVTLLVYFGVVGLAWMIWYFLAVLKFSLHKIRTCPARYMIALGVALVGYFIAGTGAFVTLGLYTLNADIPALSLLVGILASDTVRDAYHHLELEV